MGTTRVKTISAIASLAAAAIFIFYLNTLVLLYSDDYFYALFFRDGFSGFIERNIWHYQNFNGRVFVHLLVQITLLFDTALFPFINLGFLLLIGFLTYKIQADKHHQSKLNLIIHAAFFMSLFMLLDVSVLREGYLWISASFNYTLGVAMVALLIFVCKEYLHTKTLKWYMVVIAFLSGATTEQMGMTALFVLVVLAFVHKNQKQGLGIMKFAPIAISCFMGLASIFLSGATQFRVARENNLIGHSLPEILQEFVQRFDRIAALVYENNFLLILSVFGVLLGLTWLKNKNLPSKLKLGFVYSAIMLSINFMPYFAPLAMAALAITIIFLLYSCVALMRNKEHVFSASLVLAAVFSAATIIFTNSQEHRVIFPFILLMIAVCAKLMTDTDSNLKHRVPTKPETQSVRDKRGRAVYDFRWNQYELELKHHITLPVLVVVSCIVFMPVISGYQHNKAVMASNVERINEASQTGEAIFFNIDFTDSHHFTLPHEDSWTFQHFRAFYEIQLADKVFFYSNNYPAIFTRDNFRLQLPARYFNGNLAMPVEMVIHALGGYTYWTPRDIVNDVEGYVDFVFGDVAVRLNLATNAVSYIANGQMQQIYIPHIAARTLYPYWYFEYINKIFGITYEIADGSYVIFKPVVVQ